MLVPVVNMRLTGQNIASLRAQRGISVRDLQAMLGIATPQAIASPISKWLGMISNRLYHTIWQQNRIPQITIKTIAI